MLAGKVKTYNDTSLQTEVKGKVAGIIGLGNIGLRIAEFCDRLGMKVIYYSRKPKDNFFEYVKLPKLLKTADFIFPSYAVSNDTKRLLTRHALSQIKESAHVISIISKDAFSVHYLEERVQKGTLAGLGYESSSMKNMHANIFTPPSFAWYSRESLRKCYDLWIDTIIATASGKAINVVR